MAVDHSLSELAKAIGGGSSLIVAQALFGNLGTSIKRVIQGADSPEQLLVDFLLSSDVPKPLSKQGKRSCRANS